MVNLRVRQFDPTTLKSHRIILVVGKRGTGKSVLQRDLMYHLSSRLDFGLAMSPTEETCETFRQHMPDTWIYPSFSSTKLDTMLTMQRELVRQKKQRALFVLMDDCMYDKRILKGTGIRDLFMNGRHLSITLCNAVQYVMDISPDLRTQIDYVFALRENIISNKNKLWKYFFGMFEKYEDFARVMDKCTESHGALVMDNTTGSCKVEESIFWYRASMHLPPFKIGREVFWRLSETYVKTDDELRENEIGMASLAQNDEPKRIVAVQCTDVEGNVRGGGDLL
jgi:hypothetical protein